MCWTKYTLGLSMSMHLQSTQLLELVDGDGFSTWLSENKQKIADSYLSYVQCLGRHYRKTTAVFDGYSSQVLL